jgi:phenylalanyl-tRNA synthetase beta chain
MGGEETEIGEQTTTVLLEAANFEPYGIFKTSERLRLRTEGSNRWEKGVDPYLAEQAARLATTLLVALTGGRWAGEAEVRAELPERPAVRLRPERTDALLGLAMAPEEQRSRLGRLGFEVARDWEVTVPTWRARDVTREIDLVEEVARFRLDDVPFTLPLRRAAFGRLTPQQRLRRTVEDVLVGCGLTEVYTSALVASDPDPQALELPTPLTAEQRILRTALLGGLVDVARRNRDVGNEDVDLFEIARVYLPPATPRPTERVRVGGLVEGGFARAKGVVETLYETLAVEPRFERAQHEFLHPHRAAQTAEGWLGELHPARLEGRWGAFELDLGSILERLPARRVYDDVITYPAVRQDLAFAVDEDVDAGSIVEVAREAAGPELRGMRVFDVYRGDQLGPGKKSLAFRVAFQAPDRTLTDADAAALRERIVAAVGDRLGGELRA